MSFRSFPRPAAPSPGGTPGESARAPRLAPPPSGGGC